MPQNGMPERAASEVLPPDVVKVVAHLAKVPPASLTTRACWHRIAQAGGYLGRTSDGEPGWKTLWKGWLYIQTLLEGVHLASELSLE
jgi:Transposase Tn5 dimerisation domain